MKNFKYGGEKREKKRTFCLNNLFKVRWRKLPISEKERNKIMLNTLLVYYKAGRVIEYYKK